MNANEILTGIFPDSEIRKRKYASRVNMEVLTADDIVALANVIVEHTMDVEIKRSGTGLLVIATDPEE